MKKQDPDAVPTDALEAYPAVLQRQPNVRLRDGVGYIAYWRTGDKEIAFPSEDEARQGWYSEHAGELLATCPLVEPTEPIEA